MFVRITSVHEYHIKTSWLTNQYAHSPLDTRDKLTGLAMPYPGKDLDMFDSCFHEAIRNCLGAVARR
jgi:hypothetical protein